MDIAWKRVTRLWDGTLLFRHLTVGSKEAVFLDSCGRGRYAVLAWDPLRMEALETGDCRDPFTILDEMLDGVPAADTPEDAPPFISGVIGYLGYESGWDRERIGPPKKRRKGIPDACLMVPGKMVILDIEAGETWVAVMTWGQEAGSLLDELLERLNRAPLSEAEPTPGRLLVPMTPEIGREEYRKRVQRVQEYISRGDIYQANLSYRVEGRLRGEPWELYRFLREANPGAYAAFLRFPGFGVLSSSPEQFLRWSGKEIETKPIKGTRPRGGSEREDRQLRKELAQSEKDRAELVMIVDLERNDFGKFCEIGSVAVPELFSIEPHPTVWHQSAVVKGRLPSGISAGRILRDVFPGGSITGAPKLRSMQVIHELEDGRRGVYTGSIGYVDARGSAEWNIAIRTMTWIGTKEATLSYHVGGGIVADSDPELEYAETLAKGRGMQKAIDVWTAAGVNEEPVPH
ncbi:aminodeoxychorismate synthase component I [Salinithrix halophila]|uniref:aminodeoxychorismate synthase n=1 Tax=Salinithrix halophila TaxID=1485204 RepID=A0ABV8JK30_9BACL